ncbi:MAG: hypothetical protein R3F11_13530 [Verrucomicrobiales bacterium]
MRIKNECPTNPWKAISTKVRPSGIGSGETSSGPGEISATVTPKVAERAKTMIDPRVIAASCYTLRIVLKMTVIIM